MFFAFMNLMKIGPYFLLGQFSLRNFGTSAGALAAGGGGELPRHLAGAANADRAVLPDHVSVDVFHFGGADLAGLARAEAGRLTNDPPSLFAGAELSAKLNAGGKMATPYDTGLDRNPANFQPLTPLSFLARAAAVYPEQTAIIHGKPVLDLSGLLRAREKTRLGARAARHRARRHRGGDARQYAGDAGGALRRRHGGRGAQHHQHQARRRHHRVHARSRRGQGADRRSRVFQSGQRRARALQSQTARHRLRRSGVQRRRASGSAPSNTKTFCAKAIRISPG